jgi:hypothetical protein
MLKFALAGALALATATSSIAYADTAAGQNSRPAQSGVVTHAQIARFKSVLKLTPEQLALWPAVERAFNDTIKTQTSEESSDGFLRRVSSRAASIGLSAVALQHLASAAYPLIRTLDEGQKQSAIALARSMGLESMASAF